MRNCLSSNTSLYPNLSSPFLHNGHPTPIRRCVYSSRKASKYSILFYQHRVSYRGGWNSTPSHNFPYPEILKLSMVITLPIYMLLNISMCRQNVQKFSRIRSNLRGQDFPGRACPQTPLVKVCMHSHTTYYPVSPPPPNQLKIVYETLLL